MVHVLKKDVDGTAFFDKRRKSRRSYPCPNCLTKFSRKQALKNHEAICDLDNPQRVEVPMAEECMQFEETKKQFKIPIFGVAGKMKYFFKIILAIYLI
jgi:hypothetical protein